MPRPYGRSFVFNDVGAWHAKPVLPELDPRHFFTAPYARGKVAPRVRSDERMKQRRSATGGAADDGQFAVTRR